MYADHDTPTLYAGYFLDHVVTPIYEASIIIFRLYALCEFLC